MNTQDQYLKSIYLIQQQENGPASTGAVADRLEVSPASANEMIGKLENDGLADHEKYKGVSLTDEGILRASEALQTYCIIERFLHSVLEVEEFRAEARERQAGSRQPPQEVPSVAGAVQPNHVSDAGAALGHNDTSSTPDKCLLSAAGRI